MESPQETVIAKLSRLRISGITPNKRFRDLSTPELVIVFYELAEKWDVACCIPNCKKTKDRFKCVKAALRSMDAAHLQPSIKQVKAIKTDIKARKMCSRALEVMIENLETRYGDEVYTRRDWPKPEAPQPINQHTPTITSSAYTFSPENYGADDIPPSTNTTFPEHTSKENNPTPPLISHQYPLTSTPLHQTPQDVRIQASNIVNIKRTASTRDCISLGFFPMDRTETAQTNEKKPTLSHMFSRGMAMNVDPPVGRKRSRRLSDVPSRKKPSVSTSESSQMADDESPSSRSMGMDTSPVRPEVQPDTTPQFHSEPKHHIEASPPREFQTDNTYLFQPTEMERIKPTLTQQPRPKPKLKGEQANAKFQDNLHRIGKTMTQTIEVVGIDQHFLHSPYGIHVRRVLGMVFARLQDYGVQEVESQSRLLWKINKPIPKPRWTRLKATVKEAAVKIAKCVPSDFAYSLKRAIFKTAESIDIKDHEFQ